MSSRGMHIVQDSGAPPHSIDYTTLVILHGYTWHSGTFARLVPLAKNRNVRVVLVNRRDYPGSRPYTDEERALLPSALSEGVESIAEIAAATQNLEAFMKARARELYDLLVDLVQSGGVTRVQIGSNAGGIVVAGWSFGGIWMTALLAHVAAFVGDGVDLNAYVRRIVIFEPSYRLLGYPPPATGGYHPLFDPELLPENRDQEFSDWVSGYYDHGDTFETLEQKTPLRSPPPTISTLTSEEVAEALYLPPGSPGGSDDALLKSGIRLDMFKKLKERALYLRDGPLLDDAWPNVEVRYVSCGRSVWELAWCTWALRHELQVAKQEGLPMRKVGMAHIREANHFAPWDMPEHTIRALVGEEVEL
ncbi:hypothetical protein BC628DRAFT_1412722 [Trametes gibbosa]|nr:hypothetical protein BC628DRAFT_1412722 [Trametes gibbosa]